MKTKKQAVPSPKPDPVVKDRNTGQLIYTLGDDVQRAHKLLLDAIDAGERDEAGLVTADYEFAARQLIRAIFAYIEAITFSVKVQAATYCMENGLDISPPESYFAADTDHYLDDHGGVREQRAMIRLATNVRFAFALLDKAHGIKPSLFDPSAEWWSCLKASIRVRDRLTHPKMPADADVTGDEIVTALKARDGFNDLLLAYPSYSRRRKKSRRKG